MNDTENYPLRFDELYIYDGEAEVGNFYWECEYEHFPSEKDTLFLNLYVNVTAEDLKKILAEMERLIEEHKKSPFCTFDE